MNKKEIKRMATNYIRKYGSHGDAIRVLREEARDWAKAARESEPIDEEFMAKATMRREAANEIADRALQEAVQDSEKEDVILEQYQRSHAKSIASITDATERANRLSVETQNAFYASIGSTMRIVDPVEEGDADFNMDQGTYRYKAAMRLLRKLENAHHAPYDTVDILFTIKQDLYTARGLGYRADWEKVSKRVHRVTKKSMFNNNH